MEFLYDSTESVLNKCRPGILICLLLLTKRFTGWGVHLLPSYSALHSHYTLKIFRFEDDISRFFREEKGSQKSISAVVRIY